MKRKLTIVLFVMIVFPALGVNICLQKAAEQAKIDILRLEALLSQGNEDSRNGGSQDNTIVKDYTGYPEPCQSWIWRDDNGHISWTTDEAVARALEEKGYSVSWWSGETMDCWIVCPDAECSPRECKP